MEMTDNQANLFDDPGLLRRAVADTKKPAQRLACLADYTGKISNILEDLQAVERFIQSAENQENNWACGKIFAKWLVDNNFRCST